MVKALDLKDQKIGMLTILYRVAENDSRGGSLWQCKCDCGIIKIISRGYLKDKRCKIKSCGCIVKNQYQDLTGIKFGSYVVICRDNNYKHSRAGWICQCICGKLTTVDGGDLRSGHSRSCGCQSTTFQDLTGKNFAYWTVIKRSGTANTSGNITWLCQCLCGTKKIVTGATLKNGESKSCGCKNKKTAKQRGLIKVLGIYKRNAKRRRLPFHLTEKEVMKLITSDCHYCGCSPSNKHTIPKFKYSDEERIFMANGIDRIDSNLPYFVKNCVPCCKVCNKSKSDLSPEKWIANMKKVIEHNSKRI